MLLTKAYITKLPEKGDNIYKVRAPMYEDNTGQEAIYDAIVCTTPGVYNSYSVGDCVFIEFENELQITAVIMGKLDTGVVDTKNTNYNEVSELKVNDKITLPADTEINGQSLTNIVNTVNNFNSGSNFKYKQVRT